MNDEVVLLDFSRRGLERLEETVLVPNLPVSRLLGLSTAAILSDLHLYTYRTIATIKHYKKLICSCGTLAECIAPPMCNSYFNITASDAN